VATNHEAESSKFSGRAKKPSTYDDSSVGGSPITIGFSNNYARPSGFRF